MYYMNLQRNLATGAGTSEKLDWRMGIPTNTVAVADKTWMEAWMAELCIKTLIYNSAIENPLLRKKMYFLIIFIPQHVMCIYFIALIWHNLDCPMVAYLNQNSFSILTISAQGKFMIGFFFTVSRNSNNTFLDHKIWYI